MTKLITICIIIIACFGAYHLWIYWGHYSDDNTHVEQAEAVPVDPHSLAGMPEKYRDKMEDALTKAQQRGASAMGEWLKTTRPMIQDPRLAWIELDYVVILARENPAAAKKVFANVKDRTPPTSPVYPRIKQLEKTYE